MDSTLLSRPTAPAGVGRDGRFSPPFEFGPFVLHRLVRESAMSLLYQGVRTTDQIPVAVKVCKSKADRKRFEREIALTRSIRIPGVIKISHEGDVGETADGRPFYATDWVEGPALDDFLRDHKVSLEQKLDVFDHLCEVMGKLHAQPWNGKPLVHRDLKPSNIKVASGPDGQRPVILDWGLACAEGENDLTLPGVHPGGSPGYNPLWSRKNPHLVPTHGRQWDVYSLAVILVEVLTGERPKGDEDARFTPSGVRKLLVQHLPEDRRFDDLLARCLAEDPKSCPASAEEFLWAFRACRSPREADPSPRPLRYGVLAAAACVLLYLGFESFRSFAPARYQALRAALRRVVASPDRPLEPAAPDARLIAWTNFVLRVAVAPVGATVRVVNHRANGVVVTNLTAGPEGPLEIPLPDDADAQYSLEVFHPGHHPVTQPVDPEGGPVVIRLERLRGQLELVSTPGAVLELRHASGATRTAGPVPADGRLLVQSLDEGAWDWQLRLPDHASATGRIDRLQHGRPLPLNRPLEPLPGRVSVLGPDDLEVWLAGRQLVAANGWFTLPAGDHELELRRPGFRAQTLRLTLPPNRDLSRVAPAFVPAAGALRVSLAAPPAAVEHLARAAKRLYLNGVLLRVDTLPHLEADVAPGRHSLRAEAEGYAPAEQAGVEVSDGRTNEVRLVLQPLPARLLLVAEPAHAEVFRADGTRLGPAADGLELPPFEPIRLEVRAAGHEPARLELSPLPPGGAHPATVRLVRQVTPSLADATPLRPWTNSLGMRFLPVPGTEVLFSVWETRVQDFEAFVQATRHDATKGMFSLRKDGWKQRGDTWKSPGFPQGPSHPVVGVSHEDAVAFCRWLTEHERAAGRLPAGREYRLPTDAEWSAAAGPGAYPWGDAWPPPRDAGNYAGEEARDKDWPDNFTVITGWRDAWPRTAPVGSFAPNALGLHDLGGNVWEWCADWYRKDKNTEEVRKLLPVLDEDQINKARVFRGASWGISHRAYLAAGCRYHGRPGHRGGDIGFRVVVGGSAR